MGPLLLLTGVFLHLTRSTHSAESGVKVRAGDDVTLPCALDSEDPVREWRWAPRYPRCVTSGSTEAVFYRSSVQSWWEDTEDTFHGRLVASSNKRELKLLKPRVNDSGTFYCVDEDNQSSSVHLTVSPGCDPAPAQGVDQLGQQMRLSCCGSKDPVTWLRDGQTVQNSSGLRILRHVVTIPTLGPEHRGLWSCLDEEGRVLVELCLEVTGEQDAPVTAQTTSAPPGGHSTREADGKSIDPRVVWGIAGVLAAVLFILLMIGIYCCLRRPKMRTGESKKFNGAMEDVNPAGSRHGRDEGATGENKTGSTGSQLPQGAEGHEEIHYSLLEFPMAEGRAEAPRAPVNGPVYSEVSRKT
ncbi:coxsackievirus and adenovirus receptor homolog [Lissotriton helveticus]